MNFKIKKLFKKLSLTGKRRGILVGGIILLLLGLVYSWSYYRQFEHNPYLLSGTEVTKPNGKIKITSNTNLTRKILYLKCRDEEVSNAKPSDNLIGLNYSQLQKIHQDWSIEKFDAAEVEMILEVDGMCREHANNTFIGIQDGYVAVFYGVPGPKAILKEKTNIPLEKVMPGDLKEISSGLKIGSKQELLRTLEGMHEK